MLLPARQVMGDDGVYVSAREISERSGVDLELLGRMQRAVGLPRVDDIDARVFMRADGDPAEHVGRFLALGIDPEQMLAAVRVLADGLSHAAQVMRSAATAAVVRPGATELDLAKGSQAVVSAAAPLLGPMIHDMLSLQLRHALETEAVNASERAAGVPLPGARMVAVAFADLVGFTKLGEAVPPEDLEYLAHKLGDLARDAAVHPVRFIKTIGDAVMFVSTDVAAMLDAVLTLVDSVGVDNEIPPVRVGVAYGPAVSRAGDWFGGTVNLASRVTSVARPGSVLVSEAVRQEIGDTDRFNWSTAGARRLKGIKSEVKLNRVRRAGGRGAF
jgi:adenylate cyclase